MYPDCSTPLKKTMNTMHTDIILSGVGGQGILSIATIVGAAAINEGLYIKQAEVHGMSQRGGSVVTYVRFGEKVYSPVIPGLLDLIPKGKADIIISLEPMEALRYLPYLRPDGWVITNTVPFVNIPNYPEMAKIEETIAGLPHHVAIDVDIVLPGAATPFLNINEDKIECAIADIFSRKGEQVVEMNIKAFHAGLEFARKTIKI